MMVPFIGAWRFVLTHKLLCALNTREVQNQREAKSKISWRSADYSQVVHEEQSCQLHKEQCTSTG